MPQDPLSSDPLGLIDLENLFEKMTDFVVADLCWNGRELATLDLTEQVLLELSKKWQLAYEDDVQDDATCPDICSLAVVRHLPDQIRVHVVRRATVDRQLLVLAGFKAEPKINDFNLFCLHVHQDVV